MEKIISFITTISLIFSYLAGTSSPTVEGPVKFEGVSKIVGISALYTGQGLTGDEEHYYSSGSVFTAKLGIGLQFIAKWSADGFKKEKVNFSPIPKEYKKNYGSGHIGGISCYNGVIYAPVEGSDYSINFIFLYDTEDLSLIKVYDVSCEHLTDGIPWVAVDGENGYIYTSTWHETDKLMRLNLSDMSFDSFITLSEPVSRIQGGEFYNGRLYLSHDESGSTNEKVLSVNTQTGEVETAFSPTMTGYDNEAEDICVCPRSDGTLFHVINYDKLIAANIAHYSPID